MILKLHKNNSYALQKCKTRFIYFFCPFQMHTEHSQYELKIILLKNVAKRHWKMNNFNIHVQFTCNPFKKNIHIGKK